MRHRRIRTFLPSLLARTAGVAYANEIVTTTLLGGGALIVAANLLIQLPQPASRT